MIKSEAELLRAIEGLSAGLPDSSILLFRGQTEKHHEIRSGKARPNALTIPDVEKGWNTIVNRISTKSGNNMMYNFAVLQHYGFPTYYLDLTESPIIAAWFACNSFTQLPAIKWSGNSIRFQDRVTYKPLKEGLGYVYVLEIPDYNDLIRSGFLFKVSQEESFMRPRSQEAYLMLDQPPRIPNPNSFVIHVLEIDRSDFISSKSLKELFPHPKIDSGYTHLLQEPFVQCPTDYLSEKMKKENWETLRFTDDNYVVAKRAVNIPFYINEENDLFDFKPKRNDRTIFEPPSFRLWKNASFNLSKFHRGNSCEIAEATKITISPRGLISLLKCEDNIKLEWPQVNSDNIFFVKGELDHDIASDHQPPYIGTWLYKHDDLIIETSVNCNKGGELEFSPCHAYTFSQNKLTPVSIENECSCGDPAQHLLIIEAFFRIHGQIERQKTALIQNPFEVENWLILL